MKENIHDWFLYYFNSFSCGKAIIEISTPSFSKDPKTYCINRNGEILFTLKPYLICSKFEEENVLFVSDESDKRALFDQNGNNLTGFTYKHIIYGSENGFFEVIKNGLHGHIDLNGKVIIPCMYEDGGYFSEGLAPVKKNGKWGMIDATNTVIIPLIYEECNICNHNLIAAKKNGKFGIIDRFNNVICDFKFDDILLSSKRDYPQHIAKIGEKWGLIDKNGKTLLDFKYDNIDVFNDFNGYFLVKSDEKFAIYSCVLGGFLTGFEFDETEYAFVGNDECPTFPVKKGDKWGVLDSCGNSITKFVYDYQDGFNENLCVVKKNDKWGAIDILGNEVIPFDYDRLFSSKENLLIAEKNDYEGCINQKNETVIPFGKFGGYRHWFFEGFISAIDRNGDWQYVDRNGEILDIK